MLTFIVNEYITLSLKNEKTVIYVNNEEFMQCKSLLLNIPAKYVQFLYDVESIDDAAEVLEWSETEQKPVEFRIPPEVEFWGHCSNLQTWVENNYDTRLIHSYLSFPLLKKLTDVGDKNAIKVFKLEIIRRLIESNYTTREFLIDRRYVNYLNEEDIRVVLPIEEVMVLEDLEEKLNIKFSFTWYLGDITDPSNWPRNYYYIENYRIVGLKIVKSHVKKFPEIIADLNGLQYLDMSNNYSSYIPKSIGKLSKLEILDLSCNDFEDIPISFKNLKKLKELKMWDNKLKEIPSVLKNIDSLEILYLEGNPVDKFPEILGNLKRGKEAIYKKY